MSDAPAFFRAIEADPDDDTPRLVYADWLDEHAASDADCARAEFIRVQCELARDPLPDRKAELEARERELLTAHWRAWLAGWPLKLLFTIYRRGFLTPVAISGGDFAPHGLFLSQQAPLYHLEFARVQNRMPAVAACPQLALVRRLSLSRAQVRNTGLTAFAASSHLGNIQFLDLSQNQVGIRGATDLAAARMPALRDLRLRRNPISDRGLLALALANWPALEGLDVSWCGLRSPGVIGLADGPLAPRLVSLRLEVNPMVTEPAQVRLAQAPLARLKRLVMGNPLTTDEVAETLAANPALTNLSELYLDGLSVTERGARAILESPYLRGLTRLRLSARLTSVDVLGRLLERFGAGFNPPADVWEAPR